jgi:hypothetical protein
MPRGGQFGYIFTKDFQGDAEILQTIAHELGHGKLLLKHTFDKDYGIAQGTTDNLMDYAKGKTHLAKWQWDVLADPGIAQGVFDKDEDGMVTIIKNSPLNVFRILESIRFVQMTDEPIKLKERAVIYYAENIILNDGKKYDKITIHVNLSGEFSLDTKNINKYYTISIAGSASQKEDFKKYMFTNIALTEIKNAWAKQINFMLSAEFENKNDAILRINVLPVESYSWLTMSQRYSMLSHILSQIDIRESKYLQDNDELIELKQEERLIALISSVKREEYNELFTTLQKNNIMETLCYRVDDWGGKENYSKLIGILSSQFYKARKDELMDAKANPNKYQNVLWQKKFDTREDFGNVRYSKRYENNKLLFTLQWGTLIDFIDFSRKYPLPAIDPFDIVIMNVGTIPTHLCDNCLEKGDRLPMPAFLFEWICNEYNNQQIIKYIDTGITLSSFVKAVSAAIKSPSIINNIIAMIGGVNVANLFVSFDEIIEKLPEVAISGWRILSSLADAKSPIEQMVMVNEIDQIATFILCWDAFKATDTYKELMTTNPETLKELQNFIDLTKNVLEE